MNPREYGQMYAVEDFHWWYVALHELIIAAIKEAGVGETGLRILDAGCGTGRLCQLLGSLGSVTGCDISPRALQLCAERGLTSLFQADLNSVSLPEARYDVITSIDTLYHQEIQNERTVVDKFHAALRPGGVLILNLVAHEFLRSTHDIAVHTRKRYTRGEVAALLTDCGFTITVCSYRLGFLFFPIAAVRLLKKGLHRPAAPQAVASDVTAPHPAVNRLLLGLARLENRLVLRSAVPFGSSVFAVAKKPTRS